MSDSLRPHRLQHARLPSLALLPGVCSDSCPLSGCCYLTISSSAAPFSSTMLMLTKRKLTVSSVNVKGKKSIINMKEQHFIIISFSLHNSKFILSSLRSELNPSLFSQYQETAEKSTLLYRGICFCLPLSFLKFPCRVWQAP